MQRVFPLQALHTGGYRAMSGCVSSPSATESQCQAKAAVRPGDAGHVNPGTKRGNGMGRHIDKRSLVARGALNRDPASLIDRETTNGTRRMRYIYAVFSGSYRECFMAQCGVRTANP